MQRNAWSRCTFIALIFLSCTKYQFVRKCNEHLVSLIMFDRYLYLRREVCIRMIDVPGIHIPGTYHTTASAVCLHSLQSYRVFLILAAACCFSKFAPDRDSRVLVALYRCLPPNMVTAHFAPVFFFYFVQSGTFFSKSTRSTVEFYETCIQAAASLQRRDNIGGWLHRLRRSVAVRSDAWVVVMLLHLECVQRNEWSCRTFVA